LAPLAQKLAPVANALLPLAPVRWAIEKTIGVDRRRVLPTYAKQDFASWFRRRSVRPRGSEGETRLGTPVQSATSGDPGSEGGQLDPAGPKGGASSAPSPDGRRVAIFADTWTMYNEPAVGRDATRVLEALGYAVELVPYRCCGRPKISKGLLREARSLAERNVARLSEYVDAGIPVVGLEPSCVTAFQDDYRSLVPGEDTERVAGHVKMIDQFLAKAWTGGSFQPEDAFAKSEGKVLLHGHCQQKAILGTAATKAVLGWASDDVVELDSGCCGMAGSFGYSHHEISMKCGERRLFPAVRAHDGDTAACGFSCRHQIADGTGKRSRHVVEILADRLRDA
jgi:Fe-S oxidoreductase